MRFPTFDSRMHLSRSAFERLNCRCGKSVSGVQQNVHGFEPRCSVTKSEKSLRITKHVVKLPPRHVVLVTPSAFFCDPSFRYSCHFLHFFSVHPCLPLTNIIYANYSSPNPSRINFWFEIVYSVNINPLKMVL